MQFDSWVSSTRRVLNLMFQGKLGSLSKAIIDRFYDDLDGFYSQLQTKRNNAMNRIDVARSMGKSLEALGWLCSVSEHLGSNTPDVVAQQGDRIIVAQALSDMTNENLKDALNYLSGLRKRFRNAKIFLAIDMMNYSLVFDENEISRIFFDSVKRDQVGLALAINEQSAVMIPADMLLV